MTIATSSTRARTTITVIVLMVLELVCITGLFPRYAFREGGTDLRILAVALVLFTLLTLAGLWRRRACAPWAVLTVVSLQSTIDIGVLAQHVEETLAVMSFILLVAITVLVFREGVPLPLGVNVYQRVLFGFVLLFAAWVAVWGLFLPGQIGLALPLSVPPLHARFLGVMYFSGSIFMLLGLLARVWSEVRVVTLILAIWTGMLGIVSTLHLGAFDWARRPTWFWFVAYIGYPLVALWIVWCQRAQTESAPSPPPSGSLRAYLNVQGSARLNVVRLIDKLHGSPFTRLLTCLRREDGAAKEPNYFDGLHLLGVLVLQTRSRV